MLLDSTRLLFDLQQVNQIVQRFAGCLEPEAIARLATTGLVEKFGCAFARIWLVEPDRTALRMIASAGLYSRTDGAFARVPMGAFKIGKIAQNCIPFLSNHLAEESWVKDRDWAIATGICGFAGYPLLIGDRVIGVLAAFSYQPMPAEFIEVLQLLCTPVAVALETALLHQQDRQARQQALTYTSTPLNQGPLSEQLANILQGVRLILLGTEHPLPISVSHLLLRTAELLRDVGCVYCRLTYAPDQTVILEAVIPRASIPPTDSLISPVFGPLSFAVNSLGGTLQMGRGDNPAVTEFLLQLPLPLLPSIQPLQIGCQSPVLQMAFTQMAHLAGLTICSDADAQAPLLTDRIKLPHPPPLVLWVTTSTQVPTFEIKARLDLSITPHQLRDAVETVLRGDRWGIESEQAETPTLSNREQEILALLAQGLRDRDIANRLYISERTVKFHINNLITKLNANTRVQALHQALQQGWLEPDLSK